MALLHARAREKPSSPLTFVDTLYLGTSYIIVQRSPDGVPRTLFRDERTDPFFVNLATTGPVWSQVAYQFAHELCHVLSGYEKLRREGNQWFHESLCELSSLFCLLQMSELWRTDPPYGNWRGYAPHLASYVHGFQGKPEHRIPQTPTLSNWLGENTERLRSTPCIRELNAVVAIKLLPLFLAEPATWESIAYIPDTEESFGEFLGRWRSAVPSRLRSSIDRIGAAFGVAL